MTYIISDGILLLKKGVHTMTVTIVTTKGQIVIPSRIRKKLNIKKGTRLIIEEVGNQLILRTVSPAYFHDMARSFQAKGKLTKKLLEERARDREREDSR